MAVRRFLISFKITLAALTNFMEMMHFVLIVEGFRRVQRFPRIMDYLEPVYF